MRRRKTSATCLQIYKRRATHTATAVELISQDFFHSLIHRVFQEKSLFSSLQFKDRKSIRANDLQPEVDNKNSRNLSSASS